MFTQKVVLETEPVVVVIGAEQDLLVLGRDGHLLLLLLHDRHSGHGLTLLTMHHVPLSDQRHMSGLQTRPGPVHNGAEHPGPGPRSQCGGGHLAQPVRHLAGVTLQLRDILTPSSLRHGGKVNFLL